MNSPYHQLFSLSFTQKCCWLFCSSLLPPALLLHCAPCVTVVSIMRSGNDTKEKLKGKKPIFGKLLPTAATLPAASFGFTMWEFPRGGEKSQFIQRHRQRLRCSNQPAELEAGVGKRPPPAQRFPVPSPQCSGRNSPQVLMPQAALQLEVSLRFAAARGGQAKQPTPSGSGSLRARRCDRPEAQEALGAGYGTSRLPAPGKMLAVPAAGNTWRIFGILKNANLNDNDLILHWFNEL